MPNEESSWFKKHKWAVTEVEENFTRAGIFLEPLEQEKVLAFKGRRFVSGWRVSSIKFSDEKARDILLLVEETFPYTAPRASLIDSSLYMTWPHVEGDGVLCLFPEGAAFDSSRPAYIAWAVLKSACEFIELGLGGSNFSDFGAEFFPYWKRGASSTDKSYYSILETSGPSRKIKFFQRRKWTIFCDDEIAGQRWINNFLLMPKDKPVSFFDGVFLWLPEPLMPPYPEKAPEILQLANSALGANGADLIGEALKKTPKQLPVLFGFNSENGPAFGGFSVSIPVGKSAPGRKKVDPLTKGFRPGRVPKSLAVQRYFSGNSGVARHTIERVDAAWLHGRAVDENSNALRNKTVAVIGLGSVGSVVATTLVKSGVEGLVLIDDEKLSWPNVGRHVLGAQDIGLYKSESLSKHLRANHPNLNILHDKPCKIQEVLLHDIALLRKCDLIVCVTADWTADSMLNEAIYRELLDIPVVFGWSEQFGVAGHAVTILPGCDGCYQCGCTPLGGLLKPVIDWGDGPHEFQEPACGTFFQPVGPTELGFINSLISNLAVETLIGQVARSEHRMWIGPLNRIEHYGAKIDEDWSNSQGDLRGGSLVVNTDWPIRKNCHVCGKENTDD